MASLSYSQSVEPGLDQKSVVSKMSNYLFN